MDIRVLINTDNIIDMLPVEMTIESHSSDYVIVNIHSYQNTNYQPAIESSSIGYNETNNSFVCSDTDATLTGSYLAQPVQLFIKYPIENGIQTNEFTSIDKAYLDKVYCSGKVVPDKQVLFTDDKSWFTLIYYTENGYAEFTKEITK